MLKKFIVAIAVVGLFGVGLVGCSGETGTDEVKGITKDMQSKETEKIPEAEQVQEDKMMMGPKKAGTAPTGGN